MKQPSFKRYVVFWLSQSVSQLGSSMTSFALILWAYEKTGSAMSVSLMSFCRYLPYILVSLFAGAFVDSHKKKSIMLVSDAVAAAGSLAIFLCGAAGILDIWQIYAVNLVIGFMNSVQGPAMTVAIGRMVPRERLGQVSGMSSFSSNLITIFSPAIASAVCAFGGLNAVILADLCSFLFAFLVLLLFIHVPEEEGARKKRISPLQGCADGFRFLRAHRGLWTIALTMWVINFLSRLTYENILSPMLIARSGGTAAVGVVNAVLGVGGVVGGLLVSTGKMPKDNVKLIYFSTAFSFLMGDMLMALGQNTFVWALAAVAASVPIPFINAGQNVILYQNIPSEMQGRVFAVRNALQYSSIPLGILLGGFLADSVFEPFMASGSAFAGLLHRLVGYGSGSGMAVMFLCTSICGALFSIICYRSRGMDELRASAVKGGAEK